MAEVTSQLEGAVGIEARVASTMSGRLTSRKFILAALSLIAASVLVWFGRISDGVYATVVVATVGAYLAANVVATGAATK